METCRRRRCYRERKVREQGQSHVYLCSNRGGSRQGWARTLCQPEIARLPRPPAEQQADNRLTRAQWAGKYKLARQAGMQAPTNLPGIAWLGLRDWLSRENTTTHNIPINQKLPMARARAREGEERGTTKLHCTA